MTWGSPLLGAGSNCRLKQKTVVSGRGQVRGQGSGHRGVTIGILYYWGII